MWTGVRRTSAVDACWQRAGKNSKEQSMRLHEWEATIQQIVEQSNNEAKESNKFRALMEWRAKLAQEPHLLQPFQIDEIVREVRKRLTSAGLQTSSDARDRLTPIAGH
jgi:hypothetical protein